MHLPEPIYPCYLPVLGEFNRMTPHEGSLKILPEVGVQRKIEDSAFALIPSTCLLFGVALMPAQHPAYSFGHFHLRQGGGQILGEVEVLNIVHTARHF